MADWLYGWMHVVGGVVAGVAVIGLGGVVDIFTNTTLYVTTSIQPYRWCHLNCYMTVLIGFTSLLIKIPESHMSII